MTKKVVQGLMVLGALLWTAGAAPARDFAKDIKFDVFALAGGSTLVDTSYFASAGRLYHSRFDLGPKFTIGVAVPYGKYLTIETAYTYGPNDFVVTNTNLFPHVGVVYPMRVYIGSLSGVVHAPISFMHIKPYGAFGVEYDRYSPTPGAITTAQNVGFGAVSTANINHNSEFGVGIGGGIDRKITKRLTFRIDVRDHVTKAPAFGLPPEVPITSTTSFATFPVKGRAHNIVYTAGFLFHFGK